MKYKIPFMMIIGSLLLSGCTVQQPVENNNNEPVACTMEAKMCPDGSYVGRVGSNCEFAPCPEWDNWKTYADGNISFQYPSDFDSEFITAQIWPPAISLSTDAFTCSGDIHSVDGRDYCVNTGSEGVAGSVYTTYNYLNNPENEGMLMTINFTLRFPQCENYDEPKKSQCKIDQSNLELDNIVDRIAQSVSF